MLNVSFSLVVVNLYCKPMQNQSNPTQTLFLRHFYHKQKENSNVWCIKDRIIFSIIFRKGVCVVATCPLVICYYCEPFCCIVQPRAFHFTGSCIVQDGGLVLIVIVIVGRFRFETMEMFLNQRELSVWQMWSDGIYENDALYQKEFPSLFFSSHRTQLKWVLWTEHNNENWIQKKFTKNWNVKFPLHCNIFQHRQQEGEKQQQLKPVQIAISLQPKSNITWIMLMNSNFNVLRHF